jgi:uncharacterized protein (DUF58 family)
VPFGIPTELFGRFERLSFVSRRTARAGLGGEHRSRRHSPSTDYVDFRPYHAGDDFRRVDWNVYGRLGTLQVKLTEGRERLDVVLVLDCSSSMSYGDPDKLAFAAQLVAALGSVGIARSDAVRVVCLGPTPKRFGPFGRRSRMPEVVRQLSQLVPLGRIDLNETLSDCLPDGLAQPLVVVVSDLLAAEGAASGLEALQTTRTVDVCVLHVVSPDELNPRFSGEMELIDAETDQTLDLGVSLETLAAYRARFRTWLDEREAECRSRGIRYLRVQTDRPLETIVLDDLRRIGVLR